MKKEESTLQSSYILKGYRFITPKIHRKQILNDLHFLHFGIVKIKSLPRSFVWWSVIDNDINDLAQNFTTSLIMKSYPQKLYSIGNGLKFYRKEFILIILNPIRVKGFYM